jgi:predicted alpha/beta superfamily hydrolase
MSSLGRETFVRDVQAAAFITLRRPAVFSNALCQSGSFWWLADHHVDLPATHARFWLSVGSEETDTQISHPPTGCFS